MRSQGLLRSYEGIEVSIARSRKRASRLARSEFSGRVKQTGADYDKEKSAHAPSPGGETR
jgi:hypothetical protein